MSIPNCNTPASKICIAGSKINSAAFCVDDNCITKSIVTVTTVNEKCEPISAANFIADEFGQPTAVAYTGAIKRVSCEVARVKVVDECLTPTPPAPVAAPAVSCDADTTVQAANLLSQAVHQAPGTAFNVKICPATPKLYDREMFVLCAPDGTKVMVQNVTAEDAPLGTAPVFEAWDLNGTPYTGALAALVDCGADKVNTEHTDYCLSGVNFTRVDGLSEDTGLPVWTIWLNDAGAPVTAPVGAVKGVCQDCLPSTPVGVVSTWG